MLGSDKDYISARVSYKLGLSGPGVTVQTACSSSLVAVHMACQSLLQGDSDIAIAGAASIRVPQKEGYLYQPEGILSPDGHCRAFDEAAKGTIGGSGAAVVVLKKLDQAVADQDYIYGVIKGSAVNNDGNQKVAFTAPGVEGQMKVIEKAIRRSGVHPDTIEYIETHGTGTRLGDAVEIAALKSVYSRYTERKGYCGIGSVKTNIGHLDAAAGVTGLIKALLCLKNRAFVPSLHFQKPNPDFKLEDSPFYVTSEYRKWQPQSHPRRAAVSSFGMFPGQGSQIEQMGRKLYEESPFFKEQLDAVAQLFEIHAGVNYLRYIFPDTREAAKQLHQTANAQPAIFMIEYSLAALLIEKGLKPAAMIGHSLGEYAAACIAGVISLEDAVKLVAVRATLMQKLLPGGMAAVNLSEQEAIAIGEGLSLAAVNADSLCVLSGENSEINILEERCRQRQIFFRRLNTSHAFHSYMVSGIVEEFGKVFDGIRLSEPQIPYISSVTGDFISSEQAMSRQYWLAHITQPVRFADGVKTLEQWDSCLYLEVGPGRVLTGLLRQNCDNPEQICGPVLSDSQEEPAGIEQIARLVGELWSHGAKLDLKQVFHCSGSNKIPLPGYPFAKERFWFGGIVADDKTLTDQDYIHKRGKYQRPDILSAYCAPDNCTEKVICNICEEALGIDGIGIHDDFFALGGHSLLAVNVLARINEIFQTELTLQSVFETPSVYGMEQSLYHVWKSAEVVEKIAQIYMSVDE